MNSNSGTHRARVAAVFVAGSLCVWSGCGSGKPIGSVQGKVTSAGKPVVEAVVLFQEPTQHIYVQAITGGDGRYSFEHLPGGGIPVGVYQTAVQQPIQEIHTGQPLPQPKPFPKIDLKYLDPGKSGLSLEVKAGENTFDIDLRAD